MLPDVRGYLWGKSDGLNCYGRQGKDNLATLPCNILSSIRLKFLKRLPWDVAPKLGYAFPKITVENQRPLENHCSASLL